MTDVRTNLLDAAAKLLRSRRQRGTQSEGAQHGEQREDARVAARLASAAALLELAAAATAAQHLAEARDAAYLMLDTARAEGSRAAWEEARALVSGALAGASADIRDRVQRAFEIARPVD